MQLLDGKKASSELKSEIAAEVAVRKEKGLKTPHLAAILVGADGASQTYVNAKVKACEAVGFESSLLRFEDSISEDDLLAEIAKLNNNAAIDGFIVQLPLPKHIDESKVVNAVSPDKDVDGFHPENFGRMALGLEAFIPATPNGILELLERNKIETSGKSCVVIGRSHIVGLPMTILLGRNGYPGNCTVTMAHSRTTNLAELCQSADIIVAAAGRPELLTGDMIKEGAVIVDVGIHRVADDTRKSGFRLLGDVEFESVKDKAAWVSPVPGGVGPMTIAALLKNTLIACERRD